MSDFLKATLATLCLVGAALRAAPASTPTGGPPRVDAAPRFVLTSQTLDHATFVDVGSVAVSSDGTKSTHVYLVLGRKGRAGETYDDYLVQYDCAKAWVLPRGGLLFKDDFALATEVTVPATAKPWLVANNAQLTSAYGYPQVCNIPSAPYPALDGDSWRSVASALLKKIQAGAPSR